MIELFLGDMTRMGLLLRVSVWAMLAQLSLEVKVPADEKFAAL
jgi:hypothetical protein